jgi:hypothetical protein
MVSYGSTDFENFKVSDVSRSKFPFYAEPLNTSSRRYSKIYARIWWDNYCAMQPDGHVISWKEFRNAFRAHHIPEGLMERKLNEFLALTQGTRTILQYAQAFNHLCQYAGYHADSDTKKQDRFHRGLNTKLKEHLNLVKANTFSELVNMALTQEDCITAHRAEKKRRISTGPASVQPSQYRFVQNAPPRAP